MADERCRILYVEDDRVDQMAFLRMVEEQKLAYDAKLVNSVADARTALRDGEFDIVVADYRLGDGTAFDLLPDVKAVPMIFVTGSGSEEVAARALRSGALDYLIKDRERNYLRMLTGTVEHVLARVRAEEQVRKLSKALEQSPVTVMITDASGAIEYVNPRFTVITGYNTREVLGKNPRILKSGEHPPDFYRQMWETIMSGRVWRGDLHNRKRNGTLFWEHVSISPVRNTAGAITHFVAVKEDVTERRQAEAALRESEETFRAVAENAHDGILIASPDGHTLYTNQQAAEITGYPAAELLGRALWDLVPADDRDRLKALFEQRLRGAAAEERYQTVLVRHDGRPVSVEISAARTLWRGQPAVLRVMRDVTERSHAEQALRESEEKYRSLVERASDGIAIIQDAKLKYANARLEEMTGWTQETAIGRQFIEFIRPDERAKVLSRLQARLRGEDVPAAYETVLRRRDGASVDVEVSAAIIAYGGAAADLVVIRDITERKRHEDELAERDARLSMLVAQMPAVLWTTDKELHFTSSEGAALPRLGLVPGQVVGMSLYEYFNTTDDEHQSISAHRRALRGEHAKYVMAWGDNSYDTDVEPLYDAKGRIIGTIGVAQDVTAVVRAEESVRRERDRAQVYLDTAGVVLVALDRAGAVTMINRKGCELLGYEEREVVGAPWFRTFIAEPARDAAEAAFRELVAGRTAADYFESAVLTSDGKERLIAWHITVLRDGDGRPAGTLSSGEDITDRRRAEEERERLIQELDAFSHTVAHDLAGPLTTITGFTEILRHDWPTLPREEIEQDLELVGQGADKMKLIIDELLILAGVRKTEVTLKPLDMADVVKGALQRLAWMVEEQQPEVTLPRSWPSALGHGPWVEEIWANYLSNALKYGGKPPRLELGATRENEHEVRFWVRDNGPGIAPEAQAKLFTPFFRLHQVGTKGQGLGLSIVRTIVEKLGGKVSLDSAPGEGSTFGFTLRRASGRE